MSFFLKLQATYDSIEFALCSNPSIRFAHAKHSGRAEIIKKQFVIKTEACKLLMLKLNELLTSEQKQWSDISFIVVNQGPAPFTTLRALIATVNGISFATRIPLVGVDGLLTFAMEPIKHSSSMNNQ